jgi:hypothetical protein
MVDADVFGSSEQQYGQINQNNYLARSPSMRG